MSRNSNSPTSSASRDADLDTLYETLFASLFHGPPETIRAHLAPLTSRRRAALFHRFRPLLKALRECCTLTRSGRKQIRTVELIHLVQRAPQAFIESQERPEVDNGAFFSRVQVMHVGLAGRREIMTGLRRTDDQFGRYEDEDFLPKVVEVLLDRPDSWVQDVLFDWLENVQSRVSGWLHNLTRIYLRLWDEHPEWRPRLRPLRASVMYLDGFQRVPLDEIPVDMVLEGLVYAPPELGTHFVPIGRKEWVDKVLQLVNEREVRERLLEVVLAQLQSQLRPGIERLWLELYDRLELTDAERVRHSEGFQELVLATGSGPARLGIKEAGRLMEHPEVADAAWRQRMAGLLSAALAHPIQAVGKAAWRVLRKLLKGHPELTMATAPAIVVAVAGPHRGLTKDLVSWLRRQDASSLGAEALDLLRESAPGLDAEVAEALADLLPALSDRLPSTTETTAADLEPVEGIDLDQLILAMGERRSELDGPGRRRLAALEAFQRGDDGFMDAAVPHYPDDFLDAPPFQPFKNAQDMAKTLASAGAAELESLMDRVLHGICRFQPPDPQPLVNLLDPALKRKNTGMIVQWICHVWLGTECPSESPDGLWRARLVALQKSSGGDPSLPLALPTHGNGWLDPRVFVERYVEMSGEHDVNELVLALQRLWPKSEHRATAWRTLIERSGDATELEPAVRIALGPDENARQLAREQVASCSDEHKRRLLVAALRSRWGLGDLAPVLDDAVEALRTWISLDPPDGLLWLTPEKEEMAEDLLRSLFVHPEPLTSDRELWAASAITLADLSHYPYLRPYVSIFNQGAPTDVGLEFPLAAQRYFEAGIVQRQYAVQNRHTPSEPVPAMSLLENSIHPQVDVEPSLDNLTVILTSQYAENRELVVDCLLGRLRDGRVTPERLARSLVQRLASTSKGAKYLDQALESFCLSDPAAALTVQWALELLLEILTDLPARNRSLWLERLAAVVQETGRAPSDQALGILKPLGAKKNAAGEKARAVLRAGGAQSRLPRSAEILTRLCHSFSKREGPLSNPTI